MKYRKQLLGGAIFCIIVLLYISSITLPIFVNQTIGKQNVIIIDPGHGGNDPGKVGSGDVLEKDINLAISKKLKTILEKKKFKVKMTRDGDYNLATSTTNVKVSDLSNRKQIIFDAEPVLVVSVHQNSYPSGEVHGAQVFYYQGSQKGKQLADCLQSSLVENLDPDNHRVAKANSDYFLLRDNPYITVIAECGFLSNEEEKQKLQDKAYQEKAAQAIYKGIQSYLSQEK